MKRTTVFKTLLMMVLIAGAMTITQPAQASQDLPKFRPKYDGHAHQTSFQQGGHKIGIALELDA